MIIIIIIVIIIIIISLLLGHPVQAVPDRERLRADAVRDADTGAIIQNNVILM